MKPKPCIRDGCTYPKRPGGQLCGYHWLLGQPIETQERYAQQRRERSAETRNRVPASEWPVGGRYCSGCRSMVPLFYCGSGSRCRACASRASHRATVDRGYTWPPGMDYDTLLALQGGRCAVCRCVPRTRRLAVDHDHTTGIVRGLLCSANEGASCNKALGMLHDDVEIVARAARYLQSPPAQTGVWSGLVVGRPRDDGPPPF